MRAPITLDSNGDLEVFETIADAERSLEPMDLEPDGPVVFDADGLLLRAERTPRGLFGADRMTLHAAGQAPEHMPSLEQRLRRFLLRVGESEASIENATVDAMLRRLLTFQRGSRRSR
jgi:hypothetical protein